MLALCRQVRLQCKSERRLQGEGPRWAGTIWDDEQGGAAKFRSKMETAWVHLCALLDGGGSDHIF